MSATERNLSEKANSKNPRSTLVVFSQLPERGSFFSRFGKKAKMVNGTASAMENPSMPIVGARMFPPEETSTSNVPTIGPVQEKDTTTNVSAMSRMPRMPAVSSALLSIFVLHDAGSVSSNPPKKEMAKRMSSRNRNRLKIALVESALSALAPNSNVSTTPKPTYMSMMEIP